MKFEYPSYVQDPLPGKIICIGRNYAKHADEMRSAVPDEPMLFLKPRTALIGDGGTIRLPEQSEEVHHEVELVVRVGEGGRCIPVEEALDHASGYGVGIDVTARDLQAEAKRSGDPWSVAKGFDTFAPLGPFVNANQVSDPQDLVMRLTVEGKTRQHGHTGDMVFAVAELIAYCSTIFTLEAGDLIYTGTPEGVGRLEDGDTVEAEIKGLPALTITARREPASQIQNPQSSI